MLVQSREGSRQRGWRYFYSQLGARKYQISTSNGALATNISAATAQREVRLKKSGGLFKRLQITIESNIISMVVHGPLAPSLPLWGSCSLADNIMHKG